MIIDNHSITGNNIAGKMTGLQGKGGSDNLFADHLKSKMSDMAVDSEGREEGKYAGSIEKIREKGFLSYFMELQVKKMEELREEILESMGITEEDLGNMSPEQRSTIENMVSEEIQKHLTAAAALENGEEEKEQVLDQASAVRELSSGLLSSAEGGLNLQNSIRKIEMMDLE